ncbi:hypothetical protein EEB14_48995 [Rhodococcus sp. WS4]|nr:hypothetical protein EEB14_48995 [Rhodococcus sp. WS4]
MRAVVFAGVGAVEVSSVPDPVLPLLRWPE